MEKEIEEIIKDMYLWYASSHVDQELENRAVCLSCFAFSELDSKTQKWSKLKHFDDCDVVKMKDRIRKVLK